MKVAYHHVAEYAKSNLFLTIAFFATVSSCIAVPPDSYYKHYFEWRTLMTLFATLAVICALDHVHVFATLAERIIHMMHSLRGLVAGLVIITLVGAMIITNDMSLLTFLPLAYVALKKTGNEKWLAYTFVLQAAAANLGGMITPFGSPQNLYLYQYFHISIGEFAWVMFIPFTVSVTLILALCLLVPKTPLGEIEFQSKFVFWPTILHFALFFIAVAIVFRALPVLAGFIIPMVLLVVDRRALRKVDYGLLLTFVLFFIFAGNIGRIESIDNALTALLEKNVLIWSALASQVISNVPSAILFAPFTDNWRELLVGVNIGGVGTIIASLASLIALRQFDIFQPGRTKYFIWIFTLVNLGLLVVLIAVSELAFRLGIL